MRAEIDIPGYSPEQGLRLVFEDDSTITARCDNATVVLQADRGGLISLARFLLTLAQPTVPVGYHFHLDDSNGMDQGSCELIFEKIATIDGDA